MTSSSCLWNCAPGSMRTRPTPWHDVRPAPGMAARDAARHALERLWGAGLRWRVARVAVGGHGMMIDRAAATGLLGVTNAFALLRLMPMEVLRRLRLVVRPDTVPRWHCDLSRAAMRSSQPKRPGRPRSVRSVRALVLRLARENRCWGCSACTPPASPRTRPQLGHPASPQSNCRPRPVHGLAAPPPSLPGP